MEFTETYAKGNLRKFFSNDVHPPMVVIGSGMSCTIDVRFGMPALSEHLLSNMSAKKLGTEAFIQWAKVKTLLEEGNDLETSLNTATSRELISNLVYETGKFIAKLDEKYFSPLINGQISWTPIELLEKIYKGRHSNNAIIPIVTTNYDCLVEYALESKSLPYNLGATNGIIGYFTWDTSRKVFLKRRSPNKSRKSRSSDQMRVHFEIVKVHGSLNSFKINGNPVQIESLKWTTDPQWERVIVIPGLSKYETVLNYRNILLAELDNLMKNHKGALLLLGYGLNDNHIDVEIQNQLRNGSKGLIITKNSNSRINELVKASANLWLICSAESDGLQGTKVCNKSFNKPLYLPDKELWNMANFHKYIFGERK